MLDLESQVLRPLRDGTFWLYCTNILLDGHYHGKPMTFSGPGYIEQSRNRGFNATIFVKESRPDAGRILAQMGGVPGTLVSSEGAFKLEAIDLWGRKWLAERLGQPHGWDHRISPDGYLVRAPCKELWLDRTGPSSQAVGCRLELFIPGPVELPLTPPSAREIELEERAEGGAHELRVIKLVAESFKACGFDFEVFNHAGWLRVRAKGNEGAPPHLASRVWEALRFTLAAPEHWSVLDMSDGQRSQLVLRPPPRGSCDAEHQPPFKPPIQNFCQIFRLYLEYTLQEKEKPFHPLSSQVLAVSRSAGVPLESQTLALVVAVEAVLSGFYSDVATPSPADASSVEDLKKHIESWCGDEKIKQRAIGKVNDLCKARALDRLKLLKQKGVVSGPYMAAWKKLRNQAAHGDWVVLRENLQAHIDRMGAVKTLFYQLVFHLIGYNGHQTDYGTHGYPTVPYPPKETSDEQAKPAAPAGKENKN